ncbi:PaaI family thioesterase [Saccharococcus caldoxylosilyticus]|nr:PaaI family thioesterase [Parageobacillus caldoxylosilyticus]
MKRTKPGMSPFWDCIGMRETVMKEGYAEIEIDITSNLHQRRGTVHGGVLASLIDASIGSAVRSTLQGDQASATVEMKINYFRPAYAERLTAKAKLNHRGKTLAVGTAEIIDPNGKAVAAGSATYMILSLIARSK